MIIFYLNYSFKKSNSVVITFAFNIQIVLTFTTGSNWGGTVGVTAIVIPLASTMGANMPLVLAAIVSGAAFGAHVCFYTDVTVFTSTITKIDNQEHAITQFPYGVIGMIISYYERGIAKIFAIV